MATDPMWCFEHYGEAAEYIDELEAENARLKEELAQAHATIERSVDDGIDKIMGMSDDQIKALCAFDGHHPDDEAKIGRLCGEVAIVKAQLADAQLDAARLDWIQHNARADPKMDGQHVWWPTSFDKTIKGPTIRDAIDSAMKGEQP